MRQQLCAANLYEPLRQREAAGGGPLPPVAVEGWWAIRMRPADLEVLHRLGEEHEEKLLLLQNGVGSRVSAYGMGGVGKCDTSSGMSARDLQWQRDHLMRYLLQHYGIRGEAAVAAKRRWVKVGCMQRGVAGSYESIAFQVCCFEKRGKGRWLLLLLRMLLLLLVLLLLLLLPLVLLLLSGTGTKACKDDAARAEHSLLLPHPPNIALP